MLLPKELWCKPLKFVGKFLRFPILAGLFVLTRFNGSIVYSSVYTLLFLMCLYQRWHINLLYRQYMMTLLNRRATDLSLLVPTASPEAIDLIRRYGYD